MLRTILDNEIVQFKFKCLNPNNVRFLSGVVKGGNLISLTWALGSRFSIDVRDNILYLDKLGKDVYSTYNNLVQLKNSGNFNPSAIIVRRFPSKKSVRLKNVFSELFPDIPILYDLKHSSKAKKISFPLGVETKIDFSTNSIHVKLDGVN